MKKIIFLSALFLYYADLNAQWSIDGFYIRNNNVPSDGGGVNLERKLPVQLPDFGFSSRTSFSYLFEKTSLNNKYKSLNLTTSLVATGLISIFRPYFGLGLGLEHFSFEGSSGSFQAEFNKLFFSLNSFAGIRFYIHHFIQPYGEIMLSRIIPSLKETIPDNYDNIKWKIMAGFRFNLD